MTHVTTLNIFCKCLHTVSMKTSASCEKPQRYYLNRNALTVGNIRHDTNTSIIYIYIAEIRNTGVIIDTLPF